MTERDSDRATVLVVEDEKPLADTYAEYLKEDYKVITTYGGEEALDTISDKVDVVLLDRRMPDTSGDTVLARIKEWGVDVKVAMVTAVTPGFDIIDMGCDDYIVKPVTKDEILNIVDRLLKLAEYSDKQQELSSKKLTRNVLEVEKSAAELKDSEQFRRLTKEIEELEDALDEIATDLDIEEERLRRHI